MNRLESPNCRKCGEKTHLRYVESSGVDVEPTGMFAVCSRCGYTEHISALDEKHD